MCEIGKYEQLIHKTCALPLTAWKVVWKRHARYCIYSPMYQTQHEEYVPNVFYVAKQDNGSHACIDACPDVGFWCFKTRADARSYYHRKSFAFGCGLIVKKVKIWGKIAQHETGYRSQYMKIVG